jgi:hypothetical protein
MLTPWQEQLRLLRAKFEARQDTNLYVLLTQAKPFNGSDVQSYDDSPLQPPPEESWIDDNPLIDSYNLLWSGRDGLIYVHRFDFFGDGGDVAVKAFMKLARLAGNVDRALRQWPFRIEPELEWIIRVFLLALNGPGGASVARRVPLPPEQQYFGDSLPSRSFVLECNVFSASILAIDRLCKPDVPVQDIEASALSPTVPDVPSVNDRQMRLVAHFESGTPFIALDGHPVGEMKEAVVRYIAKLIDINGNRLAFSDWKKDQPPHISDCKSLGKLPKILAPFIERKQGKAHRLIVEDLR